MAHLRHRSMSRNARAELAGHLRVERFDFVPTRRSPQLLGLSVRMPFELPDPARPALLVELGALEEIFLPRLISVDPYLSSDEEEWLWRGVFAVPSQLVSDPGTTFAVRMFDGVVLALESPRDRRARPEAGRRSSVRPWPHAMRRGVALLIVTCQFGAVPGLSVGGALADGRTAGDAIVEPGSETPTEAPQPEGPKPEAQPEEPTTTPPGEPPPEAPSEPSPPSPVEPPPPATSGPEPQAPADAPAGAVTPTSGTHPQSPAARPSANPVAVSPDAIAQDTRTPRLRASKGTPQAPDPRRSRRPSPQPVSRKVAAKAAPVPAAQPSGAPFFEGLPPGFANLEGDNPPPSLVPIYKQAARRYHVPWSVLAAINAIETDYGRNLSISSAGALGWMQFMPQTWQQWGVDADHDGTANPYSPQDAIFAAARYLRDSGAARDLPGAIFAYNHAGWYVSEVLLRARTIGNAAAFARIEKGYALPLDSRYMQQLGRTDDGVDIETPPDGALVYSITPGIVSAVASDPGGFGPNYPVIQAASGSFTGQYIYYGHVAQVLVHAGEQVVAGQPIAIVGHTGDAISLGHGHIEIGFSDEGGAPLNQHGAEAWTPAGDAMRGFLVELSSSFGIDNS
jgi:murein DD-endopeptidase MepM/ murein hydrolase activator NlpD